MSETTPFITKTSPEIEDRTWEYTTVVAASDDAAAASTMRGRLVAAMATEAPSSFRFAKKSGTGSLATALVASSATETACQNAAIGPWNERVGKEKFRYEIGKSVNSAALAKSTAVAHNLT